MYRILVCLLLFSVAPLLVLADQYDDGEHQLGASAHVASDRGYLGLTMRYERDSGGNGRIRVVEVHPGSPADRAGLRVNDLISEINGKAFRFANDLEMIRGQSWIKAGSRLRLRVIRGLEELSLSLTTARMPEKQGELLAKWLAAAEVWYEQGGATTCREGQSANQVDQ